MKIPRPWPSGLWLAGWLALVGTAFAVRPLLPIDETRYLSVAWEMWRGGDFLVPHLNGEPYSHKPPLLFWLINLSWAVFGVGEFSARLVAPLFALGSLALTGALARRLWPERTGAAELAPLMLLGGLLWAGMATLTMFDMLVCFFTLSAHLGIIRAYRTSGLAGWAWAGLSLGLGVLAKGPVILLYVLPAALLAPAWAGARGLPSGGSWAAWYRGLAGAVTLAAAIALAWALPAAEAGGEAYGNAILWTQTAGRISSSFAHERGWWFYLALLPAVLIPWILWPPLWRGLAGSRHLLAEPGFRFCLAWFFTTALALSLLSAKQPHYLIPGLPALSLLLSAAVAAEAPARRAFDQAPPAAALALAALALAALLAAPAFPDAPALPRWAAGLSPWGLGWAAAAAVLAAWPHRALARRTAALAYSVILLLIAGQVAAGPYLKASFDLAPVARHIAGLQSRGYLVANISKYHGQYNFLGRLEAPLDVTWENEAQDWAAAHPQAKLVSYHDHPLLGVPDFVHRFRNKTVAIWDAGAVAANPDLVLR